MRPHTLILVTKEEIGIKLVSTDSIMLGYLNITIKLLNLMIELVFDSQFQVSPLDDPLLT